MPKTCSYSGCKWNVFSKGLCRMHYLQAHGKPITTKTFIKGKANISIKKSKKRIKPVADKRAKENRVYKILRQIFLLLFPVCEVCYEGCNSVATEIHHTKGRGIYFLVVSTWKSICSACHKKITDHSKQAIEDGHSQRRNTAVDRTIFYKSASVTVGAKR